MFGVRSMKQDLIRGTESGPWSMKGLFWELYCKQLLDLEMSKGDVSRDGQSPCESARPSERKSRHELENG